MKIFGAYVVPNLLSTAPNEYVTVERERVEVIRILLLRKPSLSRLFRNLRHDRLRLLLFLGDIQLVFSLSIPERSCQNFSRERIINGRYNG